MKKILIVTNILLLVIIFFLACNPSGKKPTPTINNPTHPNDSCLYFCKSYDTIPLQGLLNGRLIQQLSRDYANDPGKGYITSINGGSGERDALYTCFDLEKIKNFIWQMEHALCLSHCDSTHQYGIKFYYIKYPQSLADTVDIPQDLRQLMSNCANKHSLVMVPAYRVGDAWYDFDYEHIGSGCQLGIPALAKAKGLTSLSDGDNHGGMGPPPDPGTYPTNP